MLMGSGVQGRGVERGEKWDNCNSMINKIYFTKTIERGIGKKPIEFKADVLMAISM